MISGGQFTCGSIGLEESRDWRVCDGIVKICLRGSVYSKDVVVADPVVMWKSKEVKGLFTT